jgi:Phosphotransferase enzyme family
MNPSPRIELAHGQRYTGREGLDAGLPHDCPASLTTALRDRGARLSSSWREHARVYLRATTPREDIFARYTTDPTDEPTLAHEAVIRDIVGTEGDLRAPPVLAQGPSWLLERAIRGKPCIGDVAVDAVSAAATVLPGLSLPPGPAFGPPRMLASIRRAWRLVRSPLPGRDLLAARRILVRPKLPLITSHGDFHVNNLLFDGEAVWVIDWEKCGWLPAGLDLMHMWATLTFREDRERLFAAAVDQVGGHRSELLRLRYAVLVGTIAVLLAGAEFERDASRAMTLLRLLPEMRAQARGA